jgi:hypothetical protein
VDEGSASLAGQGAELASDMAYEANQQNSQELADRAALVHRLATALSAQPAISGSASPQMADARACTPTLAQPASDYAALLERVKVAARALVREHKVYAEDVDTLADVVKALEALAAQPAERQGECIIEAVGRVERDMTGELGINWLLEGGLHAVGKGSVLLCADRNDLTGDEGCATVYTHPAAPVGVPDGWREALQGLVDYMHEAGMPCERAERLLAAALSAPQGDRRTNYVSGSVDGSGKFQPTQQDPSAPQGSAQKERK